MHPDRRSVLAALGASLPAAVAHAAPGHAAAPPGRPPALRLRSFETAVREAFAAGGRGDEERPCRRVEIGHSDALAAGLPGCHNDRPFAGFPAGHLRIVRAGAEPGPAVGGVRLYVTVVDVVLTAGRGFADPGRPLDFASLPAAAVLVAPELG